MGLKNSVCDRCKKMFLVKYHLTKISLEKEFIPRDYEAEILVYLNRKGKSYAGELSSKIRASKGVVSIALHNMEAKQLIEVVPRGKTKWVILPGNNVKIK
jgi:uncharacterized membrane protein